MNANNIQNYLNDSNVPQAAGLPAGLDPSAQIDSVKREVFAEYQGALGGNEQLLRLAVIEADALARQTGYPHLVFPLLAAEKAWNAARWQFRQQFLLRTNEALAA